jgi:MFS family permease
VPSAAPRHTSQQYDIIASRPQVFLRAGLSSPILGSILVGAINLGFTAGAATLMDRWGRKPLLQASFGGMAASLALVGAAIFLPSECAGQPARGGAGGEGRGLFRPRHGQSAAHRRPTRNAMAPPILDPAAAPAASVAVPLSQRAPWCRVC